MKHQKILRKYCVESDILYKFNVKTEHSITMMMIMMMMKVCKVYTSSVHALRIFLLFSSFPPLNPYCASMCTSTILHRMGYDSVMLGILHHDNHGHLSFLIPIQDIGLVLFSITVLPSNFLELVIKTTTSI